MADFNLTWFGIHYKGNTSVSIINSNIIIPFKLSVKKQGPSVVLQKLSINYQNFSFHFHTNNKFLTFLGYGKYIWPLYSLVEGLILHSLTHIGNDINPVVKKLLNAIPYTEVPYKTTVIDLGLLAFGVNDSNSVVASSIGMFKNPNLKMLTDPVPQMNTSLNWQTGLPFRIQITDFFFNTWLFALSEAGYLNKTINGGTYPKFKNYLTTTGLSLLIPGFGNYYPPNQPVNLQCGLGQFPSVTITEGFVGIQSVAVCTFIVTQYVTNVTTAFTLTWNVNSSLIASLNATSSGTFLYYQVNLPATTFANFVVSNSIIGPVDVSSFESGVNFGLTNVLQFLNPEIGSAEIKIPLPSFMKLTDTTLISYYRAVELGGVPSFIF